METHMPRSSSARPVRTLQMICWSVTPRGKHPGQLRDSPPLREDALQAPRAAGSVLALAGRAGSQLNPPVGAGGKAGAGPQRRGSSSAFRWPSLWGGCAMVPALWAPKRGAEEGAPLAGPGRGGGVRPELCRVGAEEVTWVWKKPWKSLARRRIGEFFNYWVFPRRVLISHRVHCCPQESRHEDGHTRVTPSHWMQLGEKELAVGRAEPGRAAGNSLSPLH